MIVLYVLYCYDGVEFVRLLYCTVRIGLRLLGRWLKVVEDACYILGSVLDFWHSLSECPISSSKYFRQVLWTSASAKYFEQVLQPSTLGKYKILKQYSLFSKTFEISESYPKSHDTRNSAYAIFLKKN